MGPEPLRPIHSASSHRAVAIVMDSQAGHVLHEVLRWLNRRFTDVRGLIWRLLDGVPAKDLRCEEIAALEVQSAEILASIEALTNVYCML